MRLYVRGVDRPDDWSAHPGQVGRQLPQSPHSQAQQVGSPSSDPVSDSLGPTRRGAGMPRERLPEIKKSQCMPRSRSFRRRGHFWLDGTLHQTWSRRGVQPRLIPMASERQPTFGVTLEEEPQFTHQFADAQRPHLPRVPPPRRAPSRAQGLPGHRQRPLPLARRARQGVAREQCGYAEPTACRRTHPSSTPWRGSEDTKPSPRTTVSTPPDKR